MEMSRVVFFCDDRKVGQILRMLAGYALQPPEVTPVVNAVVANGKLEQKTNGKASEMFAAYMRSKKVTEFGKSELAGYLVGIGRSPKSAGTVLNHLFQEKLAKRKGRGTYILTGGK